MINPKFLCRQHLLGEHYEIHSFLGTIKKGKSIKGYIEKNLCQPRSFKQRHDDIVNEMITRDYKGHKTPIQDIDCVSVCNLPVEYQHWKINTATSLEDLISRCPECRERYLRI
jgi:molybdopterin converting factor small subunit